MRLFGLKIPPPAVEALNFGSLLSLRNDRFSFYSKKKPLKFLSPVIYGKKIVTFLFYFIIIEMSCYN